MCGVIWLFHNPLLALYNSDPAVMEFGVMRLSVFMSTYFLCGVMEVISGQLRGVGYSLMPMIVTLTGVCAFRIGWIQTVFAADPTLMTLYISSPISWAVTAVAHLICYALTGMRKLPRVNEALE